MRETGRVLDQNGIVYAGMGENLAQAGPARFFGDPARPRGIGVACNDVHTIVSCMRSRCGGAGQE